MAQLDDSLEKLQAFCVLLAETNSQVQEATDGLEAQEQDLSQLEEDVEEKLGGLQTELQELRGEIEKAEDDATGEIERLGEAAQEASDSRLDQAESNLDQSEDDIQERLSRDRDDADKAMAELEAEGFEVLHGTLDTAGDEVQKAQGELEQAFESFGQELQTLQQEFEAAADKAVAGMDQAGEALSGEDADELRSHVTQYVSSWTGALPQEVEAGAGQVASEVQARYQGWRTEGEGEADDLIQMVAQLASDLAEELTSELGGQMEDAVEKAAEQALGVLDEDLGATNAVLEGGEETGTELEPLSPELEIAKVVVAEIDRALNALE